MAVSWDRWESVQEALVQRSDEAFPLVAVLWAQSWNPPSVNSAESLERIRTDGLVSNVQVFIIDIDQHPEKAMEYDITCTPALCMLWKGEQISVRRCFRADSNKFVGSVKEAKWIQVLQEGQRAGKLYDDGETFLRACLEF